MTIGKQIGAGYCVIIALTLVLSMQSIWAMRDNTKVSENIAQDRLPRLVGWSEVQNDILRAGYYARAYYESGDEANVQRVFEYIKDFREELDRLTLLNSAIHFENTAKALDKFKQDLNSYADIINKSRELRMATVRTIGEMADAGHTVLGKIESLIKTMTETQSGFIRSGNQQAALQYAANIADTSAVYARVAAVLEQLLDAERSKNLSHLEKIEADLPVISNDARKILGNLLRSECRELFMDAHKSYEVFSGQVRTLLDQLRNSAVLGKERYTLYQTMYEDAEHMVNLTTGNTEKVVANATASLNASVNVAIFMLCGVLILGILVAVINTRLIVKPLAQTQRFAQEVAGGDLDRELDVRRSDETGKLADALRSMVASLKQNIAAARQKSEAAEKATESANAAMAQAKEAALQAERAKRDGMLAAADQLEGMVEIISSASTELSAQIEQSDRGASESAQRLQEAAAAMNEMNATVQEVARNASSASAASSDTKSKAEAGEHVVRRVVQSIDEVQTVSLQLRNDMAQLNERAQDINRIMGVISDIADQTNLLALNAAIEAARAGEAGRGFAVVADEVRKLAEKTMASTLDVSNAIRAIQESTGKSMTAVDNAVQRINEATDLANQSGTALEEIVATVEATSDQVRAIAAASEQQSATSEQINRSIIEVNDMSKLTADAMTEATKAVMDLANQAQHLTDLIQQMKNG